MLFVYLLFLDYKFLGLETLPCWFALDCAWRRSMGMKVNSIASAHFPLHPVISAFQGDDKWALIACSETPGRLLIGTVEILSPPKLSHI